MAPLLLLYEENDGFSTSSFSELNSSNRECSLLDNEQTDALDEECIVKPDATGSISATRAVVARFIVGRRVTWKCGCV